MKPNGLKMKGMTMKRIWKVIYVILVSVIIFYANLCLAQDGPTVNTSDILNTNQNQLQNVYGPGYSASASIGGDSYAQSGDSYAEGGDSSSLALSGDSSSVALAGGSTSGVSINTTTIAKSKVRIPPLSVVAPYLPYWQHSGWGIVNAYFPNGPSSNNTAYERTFNPCDPEDMKELKGIFGSLPYTGPLESLVGVYNCVRVVLGGPDNFHHGKGFEIANAIIRDRRPEGKPLLVFIDSNIDKQTLAQCGYAYVGRISLEGDIERNWDHVYDAAIAEALPWDVDIVLIAGGMKGVTKGSTLAFPGASAGFSQSSYSISLLGALSSGITEGKGKAVLSAECYRFCPRALMKRSIPKEFYDKIHIQPKPAAVPAPAAPAPVVPQSNSNGTGEQSAQATENYKLPNQYSGVKVRQELLDLAGFERDQQIYNLTVK
jgi:hypothetical protein